MNKTELVAAVAEKTGLTLEQSANSVCAVLDTITEKLAAGDRVQLTGFGVFTVKERPARTGLNPKTMEPIEIAASRSVVFKAGKTLKDSISE